MLDYINHVTYNTMNNKKTVPNEIDKGLYFKLFNIIKEARQEKYAALTDNLEIMITESVESYTATIFYIRGNDKIPVVLSLGTSMEKSVKSLWKNAKDFCNDVFQEMDKNTARFAVGAPLILDVDFAEMAPLRSMGDPKVERVSFKAST